MQKLTTGTHIKVSRKGYSHHGIYISGGEVVHYSGFARAFKKGAIEITTLEDFLGGEKEYNIVQYSTDEFTCSPKSIYNRALSRVGEDKYNLPFNNCEHFCCWCVTNKSQSKQVQSAVVQLVTAGAVQYASPQLIVPVILGSFFKRMLK